MYSPRLSTYAATTNHLPRFKANQYYAFHRGTALFDRFWHCASLQAWPGKRYDGIWITGICGTRTIWTDPDDTTHRYLQPGRNFTPDAHRKRSCTKSLLLCVPTRRASSDWHAGIAGKYVDDADAAEGIQRRNCETGITTNLNASTA